MSKIKDQKQLFEKIWEERPHISEVSGKPLLWKGHFQWHWQFAHVLAKGPYPRYKLREENIILMLPEEHDKQTEFEEFQERKDILKAKYYRNE